MKTRSDLDPAPRAARAAAQREARRDADGPAGGAATPREAAQRQRLAAGFGPALQRVQEEDEPMQGRFEAPALQRMQEEDEPIQGRFATAQRKGPEDEELLQGRFSAAQRAAPEEDELQRKPDPAAANRTGLPDALKAGVERLSGLSLDGVKVHYNSSRPAQLNALAYAQGTEIHVAPGQEQHLPHEAWHLVQQAQGRVRPTVAMDGVAVNDDSALEHEADVMGMKAAAASAAAPAAAAQLVSEADDARQLRAKKFVNPSARRHYTDGWGAKVGITSDSKLKEQVPESATGAGTISFGLVDAPDSEQDPADRRFKKAVTIEYDDGKNEDETAIFHSGPSGRRHYYGPPPK